MSRTNRCSHTNYPKSMTGKHVWIPFADVPSFAGRHGLGFEYVIYLLLSTSSPAAVCAPSCPCWYSVHQIAARKKCCRPAVGGLRECRRPTPRVGSSRSARVYFVLFPILRLYISFSFPQHFFSRKKKQITSLSCLPRIPSCAALGSLPCQHRHI